MVAELSRKGRVVTVCDRCGAKHKHSRGWPILPAGWSGTSEGADYCPTCTEARRHG